MNETRHMDSLAAAQRERDDAAEVLAMWYAALWTCRDDDDVRPVIQQAVDGAVRDWAAANERLLEVERDEGPGTSRAGGPTTDVPSKRRERSS